MKYIYSLIITGIYRILATIVTILKTTARRLLSIPSFAPLKTHKLLILIALILGFLGITQSTWIMAELGNAKAQYELAGSYGYDDYKEKAKWLKKSAQQGYEPAQYGLGTAYEFGQGVPQDYVLAYKWICLGSASSSNQDGLEQLEIEMDREQIAAGQKLVRDWEMKH